MSSALLDLELPYITSADKVSKYFTIWQNMSFQDRCRRCGHRVAGHRWHRPVPANRNQNLRQR